MTTTTRPAAHAAGATGFAAPAVTARRPTPQRLLALKGIAEGHSTRPSLGDYLGTNDVAAGKLVTRHIVDGLVAEDPRPGRAAGILSLTPAGQIALAKSTVRQFLTQPRPLRKNSSGEVFPPASEWSMAEITRATGWHSKNLRFVIEALAEDGLVTVSRVDDQQIVRLTTSQRGRAA